MGRRPTSEHRFLASVGQGFRAVLHGETRVLLAVSGGADSLALLHAAARVAPRLRLSLSVATVDHGLREAAASEVERVAREAGALGLPFFSRSLSLPGGAGLEARARMLREGALEALRLESGCELVATAHTASDQAETLLMRLARGSSLRGARSIQARRGRLVRPMLEVTREDVNAFLESLGVTPCEDEMNADPRFFRVRIRRDVLPRFSDAAGFPIAAPLARFARFAAEDEALLDTLAEEALLGAKVEEGALSLASVRAQPVPLQRRLLVRFLEQQGLPLEAKSLLAALAAIQGGGRAPLMKRAALECGGGLIRVSRSADAVAPPPVRWTSTAPLEKTWGAWRFVLTEGAAFTAGEGAEVLIASLPALPIELRSRRPGDRVRLMSGRSRKLQDVLTDARIPREKRDSVPLVFSGGELLWVVGVTRPPAAERASLMLHAFAPSVKGS